MLHVIAAHFFWLLYITNTLLMMGTWILSRFRFCYCESTRKYTLPQMCESFSWPTPRSGIVRCECYMLLHIFYFLYLMFSFFNDLLSCFVFPYFFQLFIMLILNSWCVHSTNSASEICLCYVLKGLNYICTTLYRGHL